MSKIEEFHNWAKQFIAIHDSHVREFLGSVGDLNLHEMKVLFSKKYQYRLEFSYTLSAKYRQLQLGRHESLRFGDIYNNCNNLKEGYSFNKDLYYGFYRAIVSRGGTLMPVDGYNNNIYGHCVISVVDCQGYGNNNDGSGSSFIVNNSVGEKKHDSREAYCTNYKPKNFGKGDFRFG